MGKQVKIWLIDDDPEDRALFRLAVTQLQLPCELKIFSLASEAIAELESSFPNILYFDLRMKPMDGLRFLKILNRHPKHRAIKKIVAYTVVKSWATQKRVLKTGANFYLVKPNDMRKLKHAIKVIYECNMISPMCL